jgi:CheY-like chemotaxis protein
MTCKILVVEDEKADLDIIKDTFIQNANGQGFNRDSVVSDMKQRGLSVPTFSAEEVHYVSDETHPAEWGPKYICIARTKEEALKFLEAAMPALDLVLLDLRIPVTGKLPDDPAYLPGFTILDFLRNDLYVQLHYDVPVVLLSQNVKVAAEGSYGFAEFSRRLLLGQKLLPDDILLKEVSSGISYLNPEHLLRKVACYLTGLREEELALLRSKGILFGSEDSVSRQVLRQLKRYARSVIRGHPLPDVLLVGPNGCGKTEMARAYHLLRGEPVTNNGCRLAFNHLDLGSIDQAGSAPSLHLFGGSDFAAGNNTSWSLGAFSLTTWYPGQSPLPEQEIEQWNIVPSDGGSGVTIQINQAQNPAPAWQQFGRPANYPASNWPVDYNLSGTLFLDEVVNISNEIRKALLQALGYDRSKRFVKTTGRVSVKVKVGPAVVLATRKEELFRHTPQDRTTDDALRDYLFRIDRHRVQIPPLRNRKEEIVPYLQQKIWDRREGRPTQERTIEVDGLAKFVLENVLRFDNNFADLDRIIDQVLPEERSITFRHLRPVYDREHPIRASETDERDADGWTPERCQKELDEALTNKVPMSFAKFADLRGAIIAYQLFLTFLGPNFSEREPWPDSTKYFDQQTKDFLVQVRRAREEGGIGTGLKKVAVKNDLARFFGGESLVQIHRPTAATAHKAGS